MAPSLDLPNCHPKDSIVMWSGFLADIPIGWNICDGNNGTPDLKSRFLRGAPDTQDSGGTGGSDTHTLLEAEMESHTHTLTDPTHTHAAGNGQSGSIGIDTGDNPSNTTAPGSKISGITINNIGSGNSHSNTPSFFEMAFIQRSI